MRYTKILRLIEKDRPRKRRAKPGRHARLCAICRHPHRADIERDFLNWRRPSAIVAHYGLSGRSVVYRHAEDASLKRLLERLRHVPSSGRAVVLAFRAFAALQRRENSRPAPGKLAISNRYTSLVKNRPNHRRSSR